MTHARFDTSAVEPDGDRTDLSSAFGDSAADALRGLLAPRPVPVRAVDKPVDEPESDTSTTGEPSEPAARPRTGTAVAPEPRSARPVRRAPDRSSPSRTGSSGEPRDGARGNRAVPGRETPHGTVAAQRRGPRPTHVRDRDDVDLLLLAVVGDGVANGREIVTLVRDRSGGTVELTERHVYQELHRLRHNRLIADTGRGERARFVLTDSGERILRARARRWRAYTRAMGQVIDQAAAAVDASTAEPAGMGAAAAGVAGQEV